MGATSLKKFNLDWQDELQEAIDHMLQDPAISSTIAKNHVYVTGVRVVESYKQQFSGCLIDPASFLNTTFPSDKYNEMIHIKDISFYSSCAHHLVPFFGTACFAYIPNKRIVGLSKIPRLIHGFSRRPQVQEKLTSEIVEAFMSKIKPKGCGLVMRGYHLCMICRGVEEQKAYTETTAIRGLFVKPAVKAEFVASAQAQLKVWG